MLGEEICAFVKRKENTDVSARELKDFCKGKIAAYKQAKILIVIDDLGDMEELPKGPTKKILYRKLEEYFEKNVKRLV